MKYELVKKIELALGLPTSNVPFDVERIWRAVYSAVGRTALFSLFDGEREIRITEDFSNEGSSNVAAIQAEENSAESRFISLDHFKKRAKRLLSAYFDVYGELRQGFPDDVLESKESDAFETVVAEIYQCYLRTGFFYRSPRHISPAPLAIGETTVGGETFRFCRGFDFQKVALGDVSGFSQWKTSGLSVYKNYGTSERVADAPKIASVAETFELQSTPLKDFWQELIESAVWNSNLPDDVEFLRWEPPFTNGYWQNRPRRDGKISLARLRRDGNNMFLLYRWNENRREASPIPERRVVDFRSEKSEKSVGEYFRIAVAALNADGKLPAIRWNDEPNTNAFVCVRLGYLLPPTEQDFFQLYSWPTFSETLSKLMRGKRSSSDRLASFKRVMTKSAFLIFKNELERVGYAFTERGEKGNMR